MKKIENNNVTCFDVDNTLVKWKKYKESGPEKLEFSYGSEKVFLTPHTFHNLFLKHCYNRGDYVIVWSKNGYQWAEQVVHTLGLQNHVSMIMSKPNRHVDDKDNMAEVVGDRIFIDEP